ncbi:MAG: hypothetical protein CM1200mP17_18420 [Woeseia sp.]|nr:MAG: hypothetical protein CM1200mP17_18420 [Woeseia sp.]
MMEKKDSVVVSGGFDPIHIGHLRMIQEASKLAENLIVIVNSDNFLLEKKGVSLLCQSRKGLKFLKGVF